MTDRRQQFLKQLRSTLQNYIPQRCRNDAMDEIEEMLVQHGLVVLSPAESREYQVWKKLQLAMGDQAPAAVVVADRAVGK